MTSPETAVRRPRRRVWIALVACALVALAAGPHAWAWYHLRAGKAALAKYHPEEARTALDASLAVWPDRPSVRLLASRAARQSGDFGEADRHLRAAQRATGGMSDEIAFEWALLQAAAGNIWEVDEYLQRRADDDPGLAPLAWEALADGYLRVFRTVDAMACLDQWLKRDPDNVRALELRGWTYVTGKGVKRGSDDFRRALELDPSRGETRWQLALCLLELGGYEEALPLLDRVARDRPGNPDVLARLARCQNMVGRGDDARRVLDGVLAAHPDNTAALRTRGQFALADGNPAEAEGWLRRAAAAAPNDYQTQWLLFQALQQQNRPAEAREQLRVAEDVKDRTERLGELRSRRLGEHPLDPALHYEMGLLLIRTGHPDQGEWWLQSALSLDADYAPAHAALAELYVRAGKTAEAAEHRRKAGQ
ncbi:MAG TPA: tetratricopeptide repeat protein [Gemmataceae bacterium]|nr:tetratricopeptide repeat protein [Gemmataceae bacterium]